MLTIPTRLAVERPTKCLQTHSNSRTSFVSHIWVLLHAGWQCPSHMHMRGRDELRGLAQLLIP